MPNELEALWGKIGNPVRVIEGDKGTIIKGDKENFPTWRQAALHVDGGGNLGITVKAGYLVIDIDGNKHDATTAKAWGARLRKKGGMRIRNTARPESEEHDHYYFKLPDGFHDDLPDTWVMGELRHSGNKHHVLVPPSKVNAGKNHPAGTYEIVENAGALPTISPKLLRKLIGTVPNSAKRQSVSSNQPWFFEHLDKLDRPFYLNPSTFMGIVRERAERNDSRRFAYIPALVNGILRSRVGIAKQRDLLDEAEDIHALAVKSGSGVAEWEVLVKREFDFWQQLDDNSEPDEWPTGVPFFDAVSVLAEKRRVNRNAMLLAVVTVASSGMVPFIPHPDDSSDPMPCGLYAVLVGKPSSGKSDAAKAAIRFTRETQQVLEVPRSRLSTGQGLHDSFTAKQPVEDAEGKRTGWDWIQDPGKLNKLIFDGEWQNVRKKLNAPGDNDPADVLRELFFGESLGQEFSKHTTNSGERPNVVGVNVAMIACGHYRDIAEFTSDDRGSPDRFLFVEVHKQPAPSEAVRLADFPTWKVSNEQRMRWLKCKEVTSAKPVRLALNAFEEELEELEESEAALKGHLGAIRLRIAAVLAYLTGDEPLIRKRHWNWAGILIDERERTLRTLQAAEEERWRHYNVRKGEGQAVQEQARERSILPVKDAVKAVYERRKRKGQSITAGVLRNGLPAHRRNETDNDQIKVWIEEWKAETDESA